MDIHINKSIVPHKHIFKQIKINDSFNTIYILIFLGKFFALKKKLNGKNWINFFHIKFLLPLKYIFSLKNFTLENYLIEKKNYIKKSFALKNIFHWNFYFIKKIVCIEKIFTLKNCFAYKNVAFQIMLGIWCKIDVWKLSFPLGNKNYENDYIIKAI